MNQKYYAIIALIALVFIACDDDTHTHEWGAWLETTPPTITVDGIETRTCSTCGAKETRTGSAAFATPFFGTWFSDDVSFSMTITANSFTLFNTAGIGGTVDILEWEEANNETPATKDEYPSGYKLNGTWSTHHDESYIGQSFSEQLFINTTKNKLIYPTTVVWIKQ